MDSYTNYLEHYGILGMKWGVRRYQNPDGTLTAAGKKRYGGDGSTRKTSFGERFYTKAANAVQRDADDLRKNGYDKEADAVQKVADKNLQRARDAAIKAERKEAMRNRRTMSDKEIRERIDRIRLEEEYKRVTQESLKTGKDTVTDILASSGKKAAGIVTVAAMVYSVKAALKGNFDLEDLGDFIPKPKVK